MMPKISGMMNIGRQSLSNSQTALQTVAHNIANKNTPGASRQRVEVLSNPSVGEGNIQIGMGARAGQITRVNNPWLEKQIQREGTNLGFTDARAHGLGRVEQVYNEQMNKGLNQYLTDFFNAFRELSNNPESLASRSMVRESSVALAGDFKRVVDQLRDIQKDLDGQVLTTAQEVNEMTREIANLNQKVQSIEVSGGHANDERDRRDELLKKLGEKIEVNWAEGSDNMVTVTAAGSAILVSGIDSMELSGKASGDMDRARIHFSATENGSKFDITDRIKGGHIGGALEVRDNIIEGLISKIDQMAYTFAQEVNQVHNEGFDSYDTPAVALFEIPRDEYGNAKVEGTASRIKLNNIIFNDVGRIATAAQPESPGDNTIANMIAGLQSRRVMEGGKATFDDYYNGQVGQIGTVAQRAIKTQEAQKNVLQQLGNIRESISGVSLDEETTKMIEYQKAYDASARLIKTADEMFDTVLNIKRM